MSTKGASTRTSPSYAQMVQRVLLPGAVSCKLRAASLWESLPGLVEDGEEQMLIS